MAIHPEHVRRPSHPAVKGDSDARKRTSLVAHPDCPRTDHRGRPARRGAGRRSQPRRGAARGRPAGGADRGRRAARQSRWEHRRRRDGRVPRDPLRRAARRPAALAAAAPAAALARHPPRHQLRAALPPAGLAVRGGQHLGELPVPERLPARAQLGRRLPVLVWIHGGSLLVGESDDYNPAALVRHGDHRGQHQLPPRRPRLPGRRGAGPAAGRPVGQLRADGPAGRAALGAAQHRRVRR